MEITDPNYSVKDFKSVKDLYAAICFLIENSTVISPQKISIFKVLNPLSFTNLVTPTNVKTMYVANRSTGAQLLYFYASNSNQANITTISGESVETNGNTTTTNTCKPIGTMTIKDIQKYGYIGIYNNNNTPVNIEISYI